MRHNERTESADKREIGQEEQDHSRSIRITGQFWQRGSMMYDLKGGMVRLTLRMEQTDDGWVIEALAKQTPATSSLSATGPDRSAALTAMAEVWGKAAGLPPVDWASVRVALAAVRAL